MKEIADKIQINRGEVEADAVQIESAASYLTAVPFGVQDVRTTIPANSNSKAAYQRFQERIADLGAMLEQEVDNIRGLNVAFAEFDEMMGRLTENGSRRSAVSAWKE